MKSVTQTKNMYFIKVKECRSFSSDSNLFWQLRGESTALIIDLIAEGAPLGRLRLFEFPTQE